MMDDAQLVQRCIELARAAAQRGNAPFGSLIVREGRVVAEGENSVNTDLDPTAHAEVVAIRNACRAIGRLDLSGCSLYTSCEPCWICSTAIRETHISRVVFAAPGPTIGGYSSPHPILREEGIARFGPPPVVVAGVLADRSEALFAEVGWPRTSAGLPAD
ncbi:MAG TPA: nucleoside deaminase [Chloroflexota bacterium]|nr:nucleoside deaminase [Chloroflexota bacterium]